MNEYAVLLNMIPSSDGEESYFELRGESPLHERCLMLLTLLHRNVQSACCYSTLQLDDEYACCEATKSIGIDVDPSLKVFSGFRHCEFSSTCKLVWLLTHAMDGQTASSCMPKPVDGPAFQGYFPSEEICPPRAAQLVLISRVILTPSHLH